MEKFWKHLRIARRWLTNGWQLFLLNPWTLGGMGLTSAVLFGVFALVPLIGGLLIALIAPILLASNYLAADNAYKQKMTLPARLRLPALKQSPRQLLGVFHDEARIFPTTVACLYSGAGVLLINLPVQFLAGSAWVADWSTLDRLSLLGVLAAALAAFALYAVLAASLIYALPLTFLGDEPLIPSLLRSLKASRHFAFALLVLLCVLLTPLLLAAVTSRFSPWISYPVWFLTGSVALPWVSSSLYCSYRDIFAVKEARKVMVASGVQPQRMPLSKENSLRTL